MDAILKSRLKLLPHMKNSYSWISMGWKSPPQGWIKANADGSVRGGGHFAACGGVFRDSQGDKVCGWLVLLKTRVLVLC